MSAKDVDRIDLDALEVVVGNFFKTLRLKQGDSLSIEADYFWSVPWDEVFHVSEQPTGLTIGQISETWSNLQNLDDSNENLYQAVWIGDMFRAIGFTQTPGPARRNS